MTGYTSGSTEEKSWSWEGEFPPVAKYGKAFASYELTQAIRKEGDEPDEAGGVAIALRNVKRSLPWKASPSDLIVFGWVVDGKTVQVSVSNLRASGEYDHSVGFSLSKPQLAGYPMVWLVRAGALVEKNREEFPEMGAYCDEPIGDLSEEIKKRNSYNMTALHFAAVNGNLPMVRGLIEAGAKVNETNKGGKSALILAAEKGRTAVVDYLLENRANQMESGDNGRNALIAAVENQHEECARTLGLSFANTGSGRKEVDRALLLAMRANSEAIALALIDCGANLDLKKSDAPRFALARFANGEAALAKHAMDKYKVDGGFHIDGFNFLHAVAGYADAELLESLRSLGADPAQLNKDSYRPMDIAVGFGNVPAICWLVENGKNVERTGGKINPFIYAIAKAQPASVSCLISYGFDVNEEAKPGVSPLMQSIFHGNRAIAELLADAGGIVDVSSKYADLCMAAAVKLDSVKLIKTLSDQGWEPSRKMFRTISLKDAARFYHSDEILEYLDSQGSVYEESLVAFSDLDVKPKLAGRTVMEYSDRMQAKYGDVDVLAKVLLNESGQPLLVDIDKDVPEELAKLVEKGLLGWTFSPAEKSGKGATTYISFKLPFKVELTQDIFEMDALTAKPVPINQIKPNYPYSMKMMGFSGWVVAEWIILPGGGVSHVKVIKSSDSDFEPTTINSIYQSSWKPGEVDGQPVAVRVRQRMDYSP